MKSFTSGRFMTAALAAVAVVTPLVGGPAIAQDNTSRLSDIEEIVVTAERREESVQDIPISIMALTGDTLNNRGVRTLEELQYNVPSVTFADNGNSKYVNIRGVGNSESAPNQTNGVAVHLDGGYIAREFLYGDSFFDVENVVVLRGPQGTYSGQNAAGGAIFITSKKPVIGETSGFGSFEFGDYDLRRFSGGISIPLTDSLSARISGDLETRDSFYENHGPVITDDPNRVENQPGNLDRSMGRAQLLYSPDSSFEARLIFESSDNRTDGVPYKTFPTAGSNELPSQGLRDLNYDLDGHRFIYYDRWTALMDWAATDAFRVLANFSLVDSRQHYMSDSDNGSPVTNPAAQQNGTDYIIEDDYWTAEVNLVSDNDSPLQWTVGASAIDYEQDNNLNFLRYNDPAYPNTSLDIVNNTRLFLYLNNVRKNWAVFGEVGYRFMDSLELKVGLRYNEDEVGFTDKSYLSAGPGSHYNATSGFPFPQQALFDFDATTGRVLLNWHVSDDNMLYATVSRGYKPGGTSPFGPEYGSEYVLNREVGWKGTLFDGALGTSISAYFMDYEDFQRTYAPSDNPSQSITRNVDGTTIKGLELQLNGGFGDFLWDLSFAYNDGEYGSLEFVMPAGAQDGVNPTMPTVVDIEGEPLDWLPEIAWNAGISYAFEAGAGRLIPSLRVSYQDAYYTEYYHFDYNQTPSKTLTDLFLAYEADAGWRAELYVRNATDEDYITRSASGQNPPGPYLLGAPRQIGVKLRYDF
jgi:iron complex outermembrane recepter protein